MDERRARFGDRTSSFFDTVWRSLARGLPVFMVILGTVANVVTVVAPLLGLHNLPYVSGFGTFLESHLDLWAIVLAGMFTGLLLYIGWLSNHFRHAVLVMSQRRLPSPGTLTIVGLPTIFFLALALVLFPWVLGSLAGVQAVPEDDVIRQTVLQVTVVTACAFVSMLAWLNRHMHISANQCRVVVKTIDDQQMTTPYEFETDASAQQVRRQSRLLDYLAMKGLLGVHHTSNAWTYVLREPQVELSKRLQFTKTWRERDSALTDLANRIWHEAVDAGVCRSIGGDAEPVRHVTMFGNRLDSLFNNGLGFRVYDAAGPRFVVMVLKGQPGAGKSTQALQMCVTLARQGHLCIYYTLEEEREGLIQSAKNFGWDRPIPKDHYLGVHNYTVSKSLAQVRTRQRLLKRQVHRQHTTSHRLFARPQHPPSESIELGSPGMVLVSSLGDRAMRLSRRRRKLSREWGRSLKTAANLPEAVRCVVIDSLEGFANVGVQNVEQAGIPRDQLLRLKDFFRDRCEMLVLLLEDDGGGTSGYAEFVADVVIQLGRRYDDNYLVLFAEILKARNQTHALGQAQLKIRAKEDLVNAREAVAEAVVALDPGVQIFPSLHYRLFQSKQESTFDEYTMSTGFSGLDEMFAERMDAHGIRRKTATAVVGPRDSGKSVLGMNFLVQGVRENTKTLLLSLRDDVGTVMKRPVPQEPGLIRVSWRDMPSSVWMDSESGIKKESFHLLEWDLDGILKWAQSGTATRPQTLSMPWRLPYLFAHPPVTYSQLMQSPCLLAEAQAVARYLNGLADELRLIQEINPLAATTTGSPVGDDWHIRWTSDARQRARTLCDKQWAIFERDLAIRLRTAQNLVDHVKTLIRSADITGDISTQSTELDQRAALEVARQFYSSQPSAPSSLGLDIAMLKREAEEQARAQLLSIEDLRTYSQTAPEDVPLEELTLTQAMQDILRKHLQQVDPTVAQGWKRLCYEEPSNDISSSEVTPPLDRSIDFQQSRTLTETDPPPRLRWDSVRWEGSAESGRLIPGADLLVIKPWRPGNISPDDFVDQVLRVIGEPPSRASDSMRPAAMDPESEFERVVFDDVAQLPQRYPMLERTRLFLPTLIDMFKARGITSLFLADTSRGQTGSTARDTGASQLTDDAFGLEVMTDHIVRTGIVSTRPENTLRLVVEVGAVPASPQQMLHYLKFSDAPHGRPSTVDVAALPPRPQT